MSWRRFWSSAPDQLIGRRLRFPTTDQLIGEVLVFNTWSADWEEALVSNYRSADRRGSGLQHLIGSRLLKQLISRLETGFWSSTFDQLFGRRLWSSTTDQLMIKEKHEIITRLFIFLVWTFLLRWLAIPELPKDSVNSFEFRLKVYSYPVQYAVFICICNFQCRC